MIVSGSLFYFGAFLHVLERNGVENAIRPSGVKIVTVIFLSEAIPEAVVIVGRAFRKTLNQVFFAYVGTEISVFWSSSVDFRVR